MLAEPFEKGQTSVLAGVRDINVTVWVRPFFVASILTYMLR